MADTLEYSWQRRRLLTRFVKIILLLSLLWHDYAADVIEGRK